MIDDKQLVPIGVGFRIEEHSDSFLLIRSYSPVSKSGDSRLGLFYLFLSLDAAVENWAVTTLAQNLLMQGSLASLALDP